MDFFTVLPDDIVIHIYRTLVRHGLEPVVSLGTTCKAFNRLLENTKLIWLDLFEENYDLHPYHQRLDFDVKNEFKSRQYAILNISKQAILETGSDGHDVQVRHCITRIVIENDHKNLDGLLKHSVHHLISPYIDSQSSRLTRYIERDVYDWILVLDIILLAGCNSESVKGLLQHAKFFDYMFALRGSAQRFLANCPSNTKPYNHLSVLISMVQLLTIPSRKIDIPPPAISTTYQMLGLSELDIVEGNAILSQNRFLPRALSNLAGKWHGYYSCNWSHGEIDGAMRIVMSSRYDNGVCRLNGTGNDMVGPFTIQGSVSCTHGYTHMQKSYEDGWNMWQYEGMLLPWGFVGAYRGGAFWIWKVEDEEQ